MYTNTRRTLVTVAEAGAKSRMQYQVGSFVCTACRVVSMYLGGRITYIGQTRNGLGKGWW